MSDPTTLRGAHYIRRASDWADFVRSGWEQVTGTLVLAAPDLDEAVLAAGRLRSVGGLEVQPSCGALRRLALPTLELVGGAMAVPGCASLESIELPALARCDGPVTVAGHARLTDLRLPALRHVSGLFVTDDPALELLDLRSLETARFQGDADDRGDACVAICRNERLALVRLVALRKVEGFFGTLAIEGCPQLVAVEAPRLESVSKSVRLRDVGSLERLDLPALQECGGLEIARAEALREVSAPRLARVVYEASLGEDPALSDVHLPALAFLGQLSVRACAALSRLSLPALTELATHVTLRDDPALEDLDLPSLKATHGWHELVGTPRLSGEVAARLTAAGSKPWPRTDG